MKLRFCPQCASFEAMPNGLGGYRCRKCNYSGEMREGGIEEVNTLKKRINDRVSASKTFSEPEPRGEIRATDLKARNLAAKKMAPKKTSDWEIN